MITPAAVGCKRWNGLLLPFYDREGHTLTVWLTDRSREYGCEETGGEVVLVKDAAGRVIGFEKLNFTIPGSETFHVTSDTVPA